MQKKYKILNIEPGYAILPTIERKKKKITKYFTFRTIRLDKFVTFN